MKVLSLMVLTVMTATLVSAESVLKPINDKGYGTISGRIRSLTMYRDFDGVGNGANSTLGGILGYTSPSWAGLDLGLAYNYAGEIYENNNSAMLANDDINLLNEGWLRYTFGATEEEPGSSVLAGRKINHGEVFRKDDFRQKARSIEAFQVDSSALSNTRLSAGHAIEMSNWVDAGDRWDFNDFGDVFGVEYETDGVTWGEGIFTGFEDWEVALFDAYAWDVANLLGTRIQWSATDESVLLGYYRHESDVGDSVGHKADVYGLALQQTAGPVIIEPGYFGVRGDNLHFQETTTGINHPLGASMIICSGQFNGDADTAYLKATTKVGTTSLYGLYNYTWHDHTRTPFDGQELNVVVVQPVVDNFTVAVKLGAGRHDEKMGAEDTNSADARLFLTYTF